jgi:hypothetical protein
VGVVPILRVKNTGTILEKRERHGGSWLKSIQDPLPTRTPSPEPGGQTSPVCTMAAGWSPHAYRQQVILPFCGSEYSNRTVRMIRKRSGDMNHDKLV